MVWSSSNRYATLPKDWHNQRARTWRAAAGQCQWVDNGQRCTWTGGLNGDGGQCDHINGPADTNLQWLCADHHKVKTQAESIAARKPTRRPARPHPGLLPATD